MFFSIRNSLRRTSTKQNRSCLVQEKRLTGYRLQIEALEDRTVPTVTLGSALSIGHELGASKALAVVADAAGNSYMTGSFSGTTDFDPASSYPDNTDILTARGGDYDIFVAKYAPDNSLIWAKRMGGESLIIDGTTMIETGRDITIDGNGNVYITGEYNGPADFGSTTLTSAGDVDGFVAKMNSSGNILWAKGWGTVVGNRGYGIDVDGTGNVYACVQAAGGSGPTNGVDILKYNTNGSLVWSNWVNSRMFGSFQLAVSTTGSVNVCGIFSGLVDFDPGPKTYYANSGFAYSGFVLNLTSNGKFGWATPFVGLTVGSSHGVSWANNIDVDASGNVIVGGFYRGPVDFNPGSSTTLLPDIGGGYITKLNKNGGGLMWTKALECASGAGVRGLTVDINGSIYATGSFSDTIDLDPGVGTWSKTSAGGSDIFVVKLDSSGNYVWAETFGNAGNDVGYGIDVDSTGTVHLAGFFQGTVDFDPTDVYFLTNPGPYSNIFLVRLRQA